MLSVCIPTYNYSVTSLVSDLKAQISNVEQDVEIILIDDASSEEYRVVNCNIKGVQYVQLEQNVGRAAIRNLFLKYVKFSHLLFLDVDSIVTQDDFLSTYINHIQQGKDVICGGRNYPDTIGDENHLLRWKYGVERESKSAEKRNEHPHQSFMTNNFVVSKVVLDEIRFNEELKGYGHEDTLFGFELMKRQIPIHHIENPILNGDIETNEEFLKKTEEGIDSLVKVLQIVKYDEQFIQSVRLLEFYYSKKWMIPLVLFWYTTRKKIIKSKLMSGSASVRIFNLYKLSLLATRLRK